MYENRNYCKNKNQSKSLILAKIHFQALFNPYVVFGDFLTRNRHLLN